MVTANSQTQLTLPSTFGTAYVGESFSCILSLNNELPETSEKHIVSVKLAAEMQTPSQTKPLDFSPSFDGLADSGLARSGEKGAHVQSTLGFDLREEGTHILCVNISYTESTIPQTTADDEATNKVATGGRVRLLRKLYNFNVGPCLSVRTKATTLSPTIKSAGSALGERFLLECQLENLADDVITMERLIFEPRAPFNSKSLNWDAEHVDVPVLAPREVTQVAFLIVEDDGALAKKEVTKDGRAILGVLTIHWRSAIGCLGVLSTGWLSSRPRKS